MNIEHGVWLALQDLHQKRIQKLVVAIDNRIEQRHVGSHNRGRNFRVLLVPDLWKITSTT